MQPFIDLVNMAKWLMDENQQPSVTQELGRLFPSIRGGGRRGESSELLRVTAGESSTLATDTNYTSFATRSAVLCYVMLCHVILCYVMLCMLCILYLKSIHKIVYNKKLINID